MTRNVWLSVSENSLKIMFPSNSGHLSIGTKAISTINSKRALELKLSNFKYFLNCKYFLGLLDNNNQPTA